MKTKSEKFVLFYIEDDQYALPALSASQFVEFENLTLLPTVNNEIKGIIYHNGNIVTIIDTKKILKVKSLKRNARSICLIFEVDNYYYGILVDNGGETMVIDRVFNDRNKKVFKKYFKIEDKVNGGAREGGLGHKKKVYILEVDDILSQINIYD